MEELDDDARVAERLDLRLGSFGLEPTASRTTRTATPPRARSVKALSNSEAIFPDQKM